MSVQFLFVPSFTARFHHSMYCFGVSDGFSMVRYWFGNVMARVSFGSIASAAIYIAYGD